MFKHENGTITLNKDEVRALEYMLYNSLYRLRPISPFEIKEYAEKFNNNELNDYNEHELAYATLFKLSGIDIRYLEEAMPDLSLYRHNQKLAAQLTAAYCSSTSGSNAQEKVMIVYSEFLDKLNKGSL